MRGLVLWYLAVHAFAGDSEREALWNAYTRRDAKKPVEIGEVAPSLFKSPRKEAAVDLGSLPMASFGADDVADREFVMPKTERAETKTERKEGIQELIDSAERDGGPRRPKKKAGRGLWDGFIDLFGKRRRAEREVNETLIDGEEEDGDMPLFGVLGKGKPRVSLKTAKTNFGDVALCKAIGCSIGETLAGGGVVCFKCKKSLLKMSKVKLDVAIKAHFAPTGKMIHSDIYRTTPLGGLRVPAKLRKADDVYKALKTCDWSLYNEADTHNSPEATCNLHHVLVGTLKIDPKINDQIVITTGRDLKSSLHNEIRVNPADLKAKFKSRAIGSEMIWFLDSRNVQTRRAMTEALSSVKEDIGMLLPIPKGHEKRKAATFQLSEITIKSSTKKVKTLTKNASGASLWYVFCDAGANNLGGVMSAPEFRKALDVIASSTRVMVKTLGVTEARRLQEEWIAAATQSVIAKIESMPTVERSVMLKLARQAPAGLRRSSHEQMQFSDECADASISMLEAFASDASMHI